MDKLPLHWVENLFSRLSVRYGQAFLRKYDGIETSLVMEDWARELGGFVREIDGKPHGPAISYALANLPETAPNVAEFRAICRRYTEPEKQALPPPQADPEKVKAIVSRLVNAPSAAPHGREWAHRIIARHEAGAKVAPATLSFAREALQ